MSKSIARTITAVCIIGACTYLITIGQFGGALVVGILGITLFEYI